MSENRQDWRKSSFCGTNACVEVAASAESYLVRDSKNPAGPVLQFTADEWSAFIAGAAAGEFNVNSNKAAH
jgi:hypothetical protein